LIGEIGERIRAARESRRGVKMHERNGADAERCRQRSGGEAMPQVTT
jgi:hypothetical protein